MTSKVSSISYYPSDSQNFIQPTVQVFCTSQNASTTSSHIIRESDERGGMIEMRSGMRGMSLKILRRQTFE